MSAAALAAARVPGLQGVHVGTIALATGVVVEAVASRIMTRGVVAELKAGPSPRAAIASGAAGSATADTATADAAAAASTAANPDPAATDSTAATTGAADSGPTAPAAANPRRYRECRNPVCSRVGRCRPSSASTCPWR